MLIYSKNGVFVENEAAAVDVCAACKLLDVHPIEALNTTPAGIVGQEKDGRVFAHTEFAGLHFLLFDKHGTPFHQLATWIQKDIDREAANLATKGPHR